MDGRERTLPAYHRGEIIFRARLPLVRRVLNTRSHPSHSKGKRVSLTPYPPLDNNNNISRYTPKIVRFRPRVTSIFVRRVRLRSTDSRSAAIAYYADSNWSPRGQTVVRFSYFFVSFFVPRAFFFSGQAVPGGLSTPEIRMSTPSLNSKNTISPDNGRYIFLNLIQL